MVLWSNSSKEYARLLRAEFVPEIVKNKLYAHFLDYTGKNERPELLGSTLSI